MSNLNKNINKILANPIGTFGFSEGSLTRSVLKNKYVLPPFSTLNTRDGSWKKRRKQWVNLGIKSELGRNIRTYHTGHLSKENYGDDKTKIGETSLFDPVLCEFLYGQFCPPNGQIIDLFAGGSVRGIVASVMDRKYWGCDLSKKQIEANKEQLNENTLGTFPPEWICGDTLKEITTAPESDFLIACPPYGNLEVYSDDPNDLSAKETYEEFLQLYNSIIQKACKKLKENRYACFVVSSFRNKKTGLINDLPGDTIRAFQQCGLGWYNDIVLINSCGTAPIRSRVIFDNGKRKVVKLHQNVLVFLKGKPPELDWKE